MLTIDQLCVDQLMWRIVSKIVDDAMSVTPTLSGDRLGELTPCVEYLVERGFWESAKHAQIYARQYGGGGVVCFINDGRPPYMEVDPAAVQNVEGFYVLPKWYLIPDMTGSGRVKAAWYGPRIGRPEYYIVTPQAGDGSNTPIEFPDTLQKIIAKGGNRFHRSRIIPWMYRPDLDLRQARRWPFWGGWGPGQVEACLPAFMNRKSGALRLADIMNSAVYNVLKLQNVSSALSTPTGGGPLRAVLDFIKTCLSYTGDGLPLVAIDATSELDARSHNLSGIDKLVEAQRKYLLDTVDYSEVALFSSGGATGLSGDSDEGQWRAYYQNVSSLQRSWCWEAGSFGGGIRQAVCLAMLAKNGPTKGVLDPTVKATWPSLWVDSDKSRADTRLKDAQARASDALVLGLSGPALARLDPTVSKTYPALDVDDGPLPELPPEGEELDPEEVEAAKAATSPAASTKAIAEQAQEEEGEEAPVQDGEPLPDDWTTEKELAQKFKMTRAGLRKFLTEHGIKPFPVPKGTRGGARYSMSQVTKAWVGMTRADAERLGLGDLHQAVERSGRVRVDAVLAPDEFDQAYLDAQHEAELDADAWLASRQDTDPEERISEAFKRFHEVVNMSASELDAWSKTKCSKAASLSREPITRNLRLLRTAREQWTMATARSAMRTVSFVERMKGMPNGKPARKGCPSKRVISLKNWAYDPAKKSA